MFGYSVSKDMKKFNSDNMRKLAYHLTLIVKGLKISVE